MSVSVAARVRAMPRTTAALPKVYTAAALFWLVTRLLVLVHQGAWPWMNAFVVEAARGIVVVNAPGGNAVAVSPRPRQGRSSVTSAAISPSVTASWN